MARLEPLEGRLSSILKTEVSGFQTLVECKQLTAGASQETYALRTIHTDGEKKFALRRAQSMLEQEALPGQTTLAAEAYLLQLAQQSGVPVPNVIYILQPHDHLGEGYLMEWLEGETLGQRIVRAPALAEVRPQLARQCGEILACIHAIPIDESLTALLPSVTPATLINETWDAYKDLNIPEPMIDFTARWLLDHLPKSAPLTLVHGDFRNGNLMIDHRGVQGVLDWELAQIGNPMRDLGWLCVNSWRFGRSDLRVGGFGTVDDLLAGYESITGSAVHRPDLAFWQVFGSFWWSITTLCMASTWRTGETPSVERPVIGRRSSEAQMDCVNLIIPGRVELPTAKNLDQGQQLPMPAELLEGVRVFLTEDIAAQAHGRPAFLAKVANNALGIAQRELLQGPQLATAEHRRLQALLGGSEALSILRWTLVNALREHLALDTPGLAEHLRHTVAGRLAVDQPGYHSAP